MEVCREDTKLEVDDPKHCKECGAELPEGYMQAEDDEGRPMVWVASEGDWNVLEECPSCWAEERIDELRWECAELYNGAVPEVLKL